MISQELIDYIDGISEKLAEMDTYDDIDSIASMRLGSEVTEIADAVKHKAWELQKERDYPKPPGDRSITGICKYIRTLCVIGKMEKTTAKRFKRIVIKKIDLAKHCGINSVTLSYYFSGKEVPKVEILRKMLEFFNLELIVVGIDGAMNYCVVVKILKDHE